MNRRLNSSSVLILALMSVSVSASVGCAAAVEQPKVPEAPPIVHCFAPQEPTNQDSFAQTGEVIANGTRWAWNQANRAWMIVTSEDTKQRVTDAYHSARAYINNSIKE